MLGRDHGGEAEAQRPSEAFQACWTDQERDHEEGAEG